MLITKRKRSKLALKVLDLLKSSKSRSMKSFEISFLSGLDQKSVRYALNILYKKNLIHKEHDIKDLRTVYYSFNKKLDQNLVNKAVEEI